MRKFQGPALNDPVDLCPSLNTGGGSREGGKEGSRRRRRREPEVKEGTGPSGNHSSSAWHPSPGFQGNTGEEHFNQRGAPRADVGSGSE